MPRPQLQAAAAFAAAVAAAPAASVELTIAVGEPDGVYAALGADISRVAAERGLPVATRESDGSLTNAWAIRHTPGVQLGIVQSDVLDFLRARAEDPATDPETAGGLRDLLASLRVVAPLHVEEVHLLARPEIADLAALEGRRVAVGRNGGGAFITAEQIFRTVGVRVEPVSNVSPKDAIELLRIGTIDAMVHVVGQPANVFALGVTPEDRFRFLPLDAPALRARYDAATIAAESYGWTTQSTPTVGVRALLVGYPYTGAETCGAIGDLAEVLVSEIAALRALGHEEWLGIDPGADVAVWERHPCVAPAALAGAVPAPAAALPANDAQPAPAAAPEPAQAPLQAPAAAPPAAAGGLLDRFKR
ncbi:MAG: TAXI family TRAP transporter solute-binding subunit [Rubrimonas sp.]|uniref:TAXI family TRAP transporter solute-binding subunit n=1 Tax=Rubrimonas sp. TaxID=2036015 RepID=UPI002FDE8F84